MRNVRIAGVLVVVLVLAGCAAGASPGSPATPVVPTATGQSQKVSFDVEAAAAELVAGVESAEQVFRITEDNDPNDLVNRPNGYSDGAVIADASQQCSAGDLGVHCGATIEVWPGHNGALRRAEYIQVALLEAPSLGSEWHYIKDDALLRVSGKLKPSVASQYGSVFGGEPYITSYQPSATTSS